MRYHIQHVFYSYARSSGRSWPLPSIQSNIFYPCLVQSSFSAGHSDQWLVSISRHIALALPIPTTARTVFFCNVGPMFFQKTEWSASIMWCAMACIYSPPPLSAVLVICKKKSMIGWRNVWSMKWRVPVQEKTWWESVDKDCQACKLNSEDVVDRNRWRKPITDDWWPW